MLFGESRPCGHRVLQPRVDRGRGCEGGKRGTEAVPNARRIRHPRASALSLHPPCPFLFPSYSRDDLERVGTGQAWDACPAALEQRQRLSPPGEARQRIAGSAPSEGSRVETSLLPHTHFTPSIWELKTKPQSPRHESFDDFLTLGKRGSHVGSGSSCTEPGGGQRVQGIPAPCPPSGFGPPRLTTLKERWQAPEKRGLDLGRRWCKLKLT